MWYTLPYANTFICAPAHGGRAGQPRDRSPGRVRLDGTPRPAPPRQCREAANAHDGPRPALHRPNRAPGYACVHQRGLTVLQPLSSRPHTTSTIFDAGTCEALRTRLPQSPRTCGKPTSRWTLALAAAVRFAQGLTPRLVSDATMRVALRRLRVSWQRAKQWLTSPEPAEARKKRTIRLKARRVLPPKVVIMLW